MRSGSSSISSDDGVQRGVRGLPIAGLVWLATGAVILPFLVLGAYGFTRWVADGQAGEVARVMQYVQTLSRAVDRELKEYIATAEVMAESRQLKRGDLLLFEDRARDTVARARGHFVVTDRSMQEVVDTRKERGAVLPAVRDPAAIRTVLDTGKPIVGDLEIAAGTSEPQFAVHVPVQVGGATRYVLSFVPRSSAILDVVNQTLLPAGWLAAILDGTGRIVARSERHQEFLGHPASADFLDQLQGPSGLVASTDLENRSAVTAHHRSGLGGWRAIVWVPDDVLAAPLQRAQRLVLTILALTLVVAVAAARLAGRAITGPAHRLVEIARSLGEGGNVDNRPGIMREANIVGLALSDAAQAIATREARIKDSEARFRNMADHAPVMIWVTEPDGACSFLSASWYEFTGQTPATGLGTGWLDVLHPEDRGPTEAAFFTANREHTPLRIEYRLRRADGEYRWAIDAAHARFGPAGEFLGYIGSVIDITERRAEERDRAFHLALSRLLLGWRGSQRELLQRLAADIAGHLDADTVAFHEVRAGRLVATASHTRPGASGSRKEVDLSRLSPITSKALESGQLVAVADSATDERTRDYYPTGHAQYGLRSYVAAPMMRDGRMTAAILAVSSGPRAWTPREVGLIGAIAERIWAQVERNRLDERLRIAIEGARLGLFERDLVADAGYWSPSARDLYGVDLTLESYSLKHFLEAVHPEDHASIAAALDTAKAGAPYETEFRVRHPQRGTRWIASRGVVRHDPGGGARLIGICFDVTERKEAELARLELATLVETSQDAIFGLTQNATISSWNPGAVKAYGYTPDEIIGRHVSILVPEDRHEEMKQIFATLGRGEPVRPFDTVRLRKGGSRINVSLALTPIRDATGRVTGYSAIIRDITDRIASERALRESEERLRAASNAARFGAHDQPVKLGRVRWSAELARILGLDPKEMEVPLEAVLDTLHPSDRERTWAEMQAIMRRVGPYELEFRIRRPDGQTRWLLDRGEAQGPVDPESGLVERVTGTLIDITERKCAEIAMRDSEEGIRLALDAGRMGAWTWQLGGAASEVDDMTLELFGITRAQWSGDPEILFEHIVADDRARFRAAVDAAITQGKPYAAEFRVLRPDGRFAWLAGRGRVEHDASGAAVRMRGVNFDITDRKQHEEQVTLLMREVNHRANNMLSLVLAVARQTVATEPVDFVQRFSERIQAMSAGQDLLVRTDWQGADLQELVTSQLAHFKDLIGERITMTGPRLRLLPAAVQSIGMALHELASNAGKYGALSNDAGRVEITWQVEADGKPRFVMCWRETGGPPVAPPQRRGFGSTAVQTLARMSLQADIDFEFPAAGVLWRLACPAEIAVEGGGHMNRSRVKAIGKVI